jgi:hypothetical protein
MIECLPIMHETLSLIPSIEKEISRFFFVEGVGWIRGSIPGPHEVLFFFFVLGFELRAYTLSHSASPFSDGFF